MRVGCLKVSYKNQKEADKAFYGMKNRGHISPRAEFRAYYCESCQSWHLTHMPVKQYYESKGSKRKN